MARKKLLRSKISILTIFWLLRPWNKVFWWLEVKINITTRFFSLDLVGIKQRCERIETTKKWNEAKRTKFRKVERISKYQNERFTKFIKFERKMAPIITIFKNFDLYFLLKQLYRATISHFTRMGLIWTAKIEKILVFESKCIGKSRKMDHFNALNKTKETNV